MSQRGRVAGDQGGGLGGGVDEVQPLLHRAPHGQGLQRRPHGDRVRPVIPADEHEEGEHGIRRRRAASPPGRPPARCRPRRGARRSRHRSARAGRPRGSRSRSTWRCRRRRRWAVRARRTTSGCRGSSPRPAHRAPRAGRRARRARPAPTARSRARTTGCQPVESAPRRATSRMPRTRRGWQPPSRPVRPPWPRRTRPRPGHGRGGRPRCSPPFPVRARAHP